MKHSSQKLFSFFKEHQRMPSYAELADLYGFSSKNAAYQLAKAFLKEGVITKDKTGKLLPGKKMNRKIQVLGTVQAGFPTYASEHKGEHLSLDEWLLNDSNATYLLKVSGDSMIDAGIVEGDYVVVEKTQNFSLGDIVIAEVGNEWTMKYLRKDETGFYLEAANENYPDIYPDEDLVIHAVVRSLVRKYEGKK